MRLAKAEAHHDLVNQIETDLVQIEVAALLRNLRN